MHKSGLLFGQFLVIYIWIIQEAIGNMLNWKKKIPILALNIV